MAAYSIEIYSTLTPDEFRRLTDKFRYYCNQKVVYFYSVLSSTASNGAFKATLHTGKRGRPKSIVYGKEVAPHVHTVLVGEKAHSAAKQICNALNRKAGKRVTKLVSICDEKHLRNFVRYSARQADIERSNARQFFDQLKG